jgi:AraC family transcriptional regulator, transcriptional activator for feuABC-ybbA operon
VKEMTDGPEWSESRFSSYYFSVIETFYGNVQIPPPSNIGAALLVAVAGGGGEAAADGEVYHLRRGDMLLVPEGTHFAIQSQKNDLLQGYVMDIRQHKHSQDAAGGGLPRPSSLAAPKHAVYLRNVLELVTMLEELYLHRLPIDELRHIRNGMVFHEVLYRLLQVMEAAPPRSEGDLSLEQSVVYLEEHFRGKITRDQLAAATRMSRSHYSVAFKQLTGYSPSQYASLLRVHAAMELLLGGKETLKDIAIQSGYKDEFYLSRRFKQHTGISPSRYLSQFGKRAAVLVPPYASHMRALGLEPTVAIADSSEYVTSPELEQPKSMVMMGEHCTAEQLAKVLRETATELVIASDPSYAHVTFSAERLRAAAPVIVVPWMDMGWKEHFRYIAQILRESEKAESWLAGFEREEKEAREQVASIAGVAQAVVTVLVIKPDRLLIYGARNAGYVLYQSLGLMPPERIREHIASGGPSFHSLRITLEELPDYAGDKLLVIVFNDEKGSAAAVDAVLDSTVWKELPAVRQNEAYIVDQNDWIPYNPISIRNQLRRAVKLFCDGKTNVQT